MCLPLLLRVNHIQSFRDILPQIFAGDSDRYKVNSCITDYDVNTKKSHLTGSIYVASRDYCFINIIIVKIEIESGAK